jgi:Xaa-Pro aminopeptidase
MGYKPIIYRRYFLKTASIKIKPNEYNQRLERLTEFCQQEGLSGVILFDRDYILYYTGFAFIPTERPIAFILNSKFETALFVPRMELEHAKSNTLISRVDHYIEYPYTERPEIILRNSMQEMSIEGVYGADQDGYPWIFGYRGPSMTELTGRTPKRITAFIEDQMMIKSEAEVSLIKESAKWGNLAHVLLQRYTKVGVTETEVSMRAGNEATSAMLDAIGPIYRAQSYTSGGASAGYRGQIGRNAAIPHALANNIIFQAGDILVTGAGAGMWGYHSELERTMIIGKASSEQVFMFDHMVALQNLALDSIKPDIPCSEVDRIVREYYDANELMPFWKHHVGHAIGIRYHEAPFLDVGDHTLIQPGMVLTVEPGLYAPELGGFRHSDTVLVTDDGIEMLTYYPRDLDSLTIPV